MAGFIFLLPVFFRVCYVSLSFFGGIFKGDNKATLSLLQAEITSFTLDMKPNLKENVMNNITIHPKASMGLAYLPRFAIKIHP